jgi:hypothetical protein
VESSSSVRSPSSSRMSLNSANVVTCVLHQHMQTCKSLGLSKAGMQWRRHITSSPCAFVVALHSHTDLPVHTLLSNHCVNTMDA